MEPLQQRYYSDRGRHCARRDYAASPSFGPAGFCPGYSIEIIDIDVDIIAIMLITVTTMMVIIIMVVVVMVVMIVVIPVYAAEQRIGGGDAQTITKTFNKTIGKLLPRRGR